MVHSKHKHMCVQINETHHLVHISPDSSSLDRVQDLFLGPQKNNLQPHPQFLRGRLPFCIGCPSTSVMVFKTFF